MTRIFTIPGEHFKHLRPLTISKADFVITKLAYHSYIRQHDITDLRTLQLHNKDVELIYKKLDTIADKKPFDALMIEGNFKAIRFDLVKDAFGNSYSTSNDIESYITKRFGIVPNQETISDWNHSLETMLKKGGSIIASIDISAAKQIQNGNKEILNSDREFRYQRAMDVDYGYSL